MVDMFQEEGITSSKIINLISISAITLVFLLFLIKKIYSNLSIGIVLYLLVFNIILSTLLGNFHSVDFDFLVFYFQAVF